MDYEPLLVFLAVTVFSAAAAAAGYFFFRRLHVVLDVHRDVVVPGVVDVFVVLAVAAVLGAADYVYAALAWLYGAVVGLLDSFTALGHREQIVAAAPLIGLFVYRFGAGDPAASLYVLGAAVLVFAAATTVNTYAGVNAMESVHAYALSTPLLVLWALGRVPDAQATAVALTIAVTLPYAATTLPPASSIPSDAYRYAWGMLLAAMYLWANMPHVLFIAALPALYDLASKHVYGVSKSFLSDSPINWPRSMLELAWRLGLRNQERALALVAGLDAAAAAAAVAAGLLVDPGTAVTVIYALIGAGAAATPLIRRRLYR